VRCPFGEAEMSGIKLHGAIDTGIRRNHFHDYSHGLGGGLDGPGHPPHSIQV
jgi:hypothetical protein